jgi:Zn-dependent protease with chaperone function
MCGKTTAPLLAESPDDLILLCVSRTQEQNADRSGGEVSENPLARSQLAKKFRSHNHIPRLTAFLGRTK